MSVADPVIDSWDGENRRIYLKSGVTAFHWIEDIYKEYRYWRRTDESSRKWLPFMRAAGNEPKGGGKYTPRYITLLDGARVVPYDEVVLINVTGEAITDNADIDPDPFDTSTRTKAVKLYLEPPAAEIVRADEEIAALRHGFFSGGVSVDLTSAWSGTVFPNGTPQQPVNNVDDALAIASERGFSTFFITGDLDIDDSNDYTGFNFVGESQTKTEINISASANVERCEFYECHVSGTLDGQCVLKNCIVQNLNYINGIIEQCILEPGTITLGGGAEAYLIDCWSGAATSGTPVIDMGGTGQSLIVRNYNGYLAVRNLNDQNQKATIDLNSGEIHLESSLTNGTVIVRGVGNVVDESAGVTVETDNLVNPTTVKDSVYAGGIDGSVSLQNALQVILAALAGPAGGGGTGTLTFQNQAKSKNVLTMTVDENGNRSIVILNPD